MVRDTSAGSLLAVGGAVLGRDVSPEAMQHWQAGEIRVECGPPQTVQGYGENRGETPITARRLPGAPDLHRAILGPDPLPPIFDNNCCHPYIPSVMRGPACGKDGCINILLTTIVTTLTTIGIRSHLSVAFMLHKSSSLCR